MVIKLWVSRHSQAPHAWERLCNSSNIIWNGINIFLSDIWFTNGIKWCMGYVTTLTNEYNTDRTWTDNFRTFWCSLYTLVLLWGSWNLQLDLCHCCRLKLVRCSGGVLWRHYVGCRWLLVRCWVHDLESILGFDIPLSPKKTKDIFNLLSIFLRNSRVHV